MTMRKFANLFNVDLMEEFKIYDTTYKSESSLIYRFAPEGLQLRKDNGQFEPSGYSLGDFVKGGLRVIKIQVAEDMFKELGYQVVRTEDYITFFNKKKGHEITFHLRDKFISLEGNDIDIDRRDVEAIYQEMKELGWTDTTR